MSRRQLLNSSSRHPATACRYFYFFALGLGLRRLGSSFVTWWLEEFQRGSMWRAVKGQSGRRPRCLGVGLFHSKMGAAARSSGVS